MTHTPATQISPLSLHDALPILNGLSDVKKLTHIDARGQASMVDVSAKPVVLREAVARGEIRLQRSTLDLIQSDQIARSEEHTSELQSPYDLVCRLLLEKKNINQ